MSFINVAGVNHSLAWIVESIQTAFLFLESPLLIFILKKLDYTSTIDEAFNSVKSSPWAS